MVWVAGKQLQGDKYTIERVLGHGRFGITYRARNKNDEPVVIKTPNDESLNRPDFDRLQQVFVREAFRLAKCRHPHIVKAEEPFLEDGLWCIPMEYIAGTTLAKRDRLILPEEEALVYIQQIGEALIEVHNNGLFHRDVRPGNIMLRVRDGKAEAVLIDFGLALEFDHEMTTTRTEEIAEGFAPLELYSQQKQRHVQLSRRKSGFQAILRKMPLLKVSKFVGFKKVAHGVKQRGAYTDIYSLGATLYVLLTGQKPAGAIKRKLDNEPLIEPKESNPQISDRVNRAILWAMELEAENRPQSMQEWLDSLTIPSPPSPPPLITFNWNLFWAAVAAIATLLGAIAAWVTICQNQDNSGSSSSPTSTP